MALSFLMMECSPPTDIFAIMFFLSIPFLMGCIVLFYCVNMVADTCDECRSSSLRSKMDTQMGVIFFYPYKDEHGKDFINIVEYNLVLPNTFSVAPALIYEYSRYA